jgi:hypothetical protein
MIRCLSGHRSRCWHRQARRLLTVVLRPFDGWTHPATIAEEYISSQSFTIQAPVDVEQREDMDDEGSQEMESWNSSQFLKESSGEAPLTTMRVVRVSLAAVAPRMRYVHNSVCQRIRDTSRVVNARRNSPTIMIH